MRRTLLYIAIIALIIGATSPVLAQTGASCASPIRLGKNYSATITGAGTKWYVANTFDLPLTVKFYPSNTSAAPPDIEMDFGCTAGVYDDSIVCSLFCYANGSYVTLPHRVTPDQKTDAQGKLYYEVAMGEFYRDMLLRAGISYDLDVFVKVVYHGAGTINLTPDEEFSQCMETDKWLLLDRTLSVSANDTETFFIAPYANWTTDSVRYIWSGAQPATVVIGTTCSFDPMDATDDRRIDVMQMRAGGDTVNHTNADITYYMTYMLNPSNKAKGGMFYVKVVSAGAGTLKVERMPEPLPDQGATLLAYNQATPITGDTASLYAIPRSWTAATRFDTPTDRVFKMYIGTTADFQLREAIATCPFNATDDGHWFGLMQTEMEALWTQTGQKYLYVRFACSKPTTITPTPWEPSDCIGKASIVRNNTTLDIATRSKVIHRFYYNDWTGGDMTVTWTKSTQCKMLVSGECTIGTNENAETIFYYQSLNQTPLIIPAATIAEWASNVDADGYFYMRFYSSTSGQITIASDAPEETDPEEEPAQNVPHATVYVACLDNTTGVRVLVSTPQAMHMSDASGTVIWQQTVLPGQPEEVVLQPGLYLLTGEHEQIEIHL